MRVLILKRNNFSFPTFKFRISSKSKEKDRKHPTPDFQVNLSTDEHIYHEVDRILDKINAKGFGSLTNSEKQLLDKAKSFLQKD